jgi:dihydrolipoamide dehydrogenase
LGIIKTNIEKRGFMDTFDVVVIGAGPGGYVAAIRSAQLGFSVAIVEKEWLGGVCLNVGCVPSKALLKNADVAHTLRERGRDFGFSFDNLHLDFSAAVKRSRQVSDRLTRGVGFLMKKHNITVIMGAAKLTGNRTIQVKQTDGTTYDLQAANIIIATGARPAVIPGITIDGEKILTYREAILQEKLPASVVIIGAGAIGLEFATVWSAYGSQVTLVEMLPSIAPMEDAEVSAELTKAFSKRGVKIHADTRVKSVTSTPDGVKVTIENSEGLSELESEQVLVATGFKPNSLDLGLEETGVELTERKFIKIDDAYSTNIPGIRAIGDVTGKFMLAHVASKQGIQCAEAIAGKPIEEIDYVMVPRATYCHPQVASFGYTETQARETGRAIKIGKFPFQANGKALGLGDYSGFVKVITDEESKQLLGAHLVGPEVSELLPELTLAQVNDLTIDLVASNIHAHPTLSEALMEAAEAAEGKAIHI